MTPTTNKIVYGKVAYEGFAKAIGAKLGLNVKVEDGAAACIDAKGVVKLPRMQTYQTAAEFEETCGVIVHELSHQFYKSHTQVDPSAGRLAHECFNAVLDVADETWVTEVFKRQGNVRVDQLLVGINGSALERNASMLFDWSNADTHLWKVLCVGILAARLPKFHRRFVRHTVRHAARYGVDAKAAFRLLRRARLSAKQDPAPTMKRFGRLRKIAAQLADLLKPFDPPSAAAANPNEIGGEVGSRLSEATGRGAKSLPAGAVEAGESAGQAAASDKAAGKAGGRGPASARSSEFDRDAFALLAPAVQRVADRIAVDGDSAERIGGLSSGPCIAEAHRLMTDGQCLSKWGVNEHADGVSVAVLLDCSGSMAPQLPQCAGIARAFSVAMRAAGSVKTLAFGTDVLESEDFERVGSMGGTSTHKAIEKAMEFLRDRSGRRWIILITDGMPTDRERTDAACRDAVAAGIRILSIGLGDVVEMPFGTCVKAIDATHLAIELDAATLRIEQEVC